MNETNFHSKYLIEILIEQYQANEIELSTFNNIINNEKLAFKVIIFISQVEAFVPYEDLDFRKKIIQGACHIALEALSENPTINLFESFLKKI
ncbi:hypothetical protein [Lutibacter citreus]|uniref:hypothetical protein n=1 Tax=Lutibacter citreus TaxID=2138210 RepID=UPI000DBE7FD1|nr:hypothetical protein [Lutibacter citreus]